MQVLVRSLAFVDLSSHPQISCFMMQKEEIEQMQGRQDRGFGDCHPKTDESP